jgi:hypothetical protein
MKRFCWLWPALLFLPLFQTACQSSLPASLGVRAAADEMLAPAPGSTTWRLSETFDPYQGGQTMRKGPARTQYLVLDKEGIFRSFDPENSGAGRWYLHQEKDRMALVYHYQNGQAIPEEQRDSQYRYQILQHQADTLVLGIQGRHGIVRQTYVRATP